MRPLFRALRAAAALGAAAWLVVPAHAADQTVTVGSAQANTFSPNKVTIDPGDTVTWQYGGGQGHTVTSTSSNWDKNVSVGPPDGTLTLSTTFTFTKPGTYTYVCRTHESAGMRGSVIVRGATKSPTPTHTTHPPTSRPPSSPPASSSSPAVTPSAGGPSLTPPATAVPTPTMTPVFPTGFPTQPGTPGGTPFLGSGGLTRQPVTGRGKGLPVMVALLLIGGVGSAELRALLANAP